MHNTLNGGNSAAAIGAAILKSFTNADDIVKSEEQRNIEKALTDGTMKVVTVEDITKSYGGKFYTPENVSKLEKEIEEKIVKGENDHLSAEEFNAVEKAQEDLNSLEQVIVKGEHEGQTFLKRVYVQKHVEEA